MSAGAAGAGLFVVVRSSNPEGRNLQTARADDGRTVERALIEEIAEWSGGGIRGDNEMPMAYPGGIDVAARRHRQVGGIQRDEVEHRVGGGGGQLVDDPAVGVERPRRPRPLLGQAGAHGHATAVRVAGQVGVVVARHEHARPVQPAGEVVEIVER